MKKGGRCSSTSVKKMPQRLRGFLNIENIENGNVKKIRIITRLFENKHFVILKYAPAFDKISGQSRPDLIKAKDVFNRINYRYGLGETWFISESGNLFQDSVISLSFRLFNWINYRNMLFEEGIDKAFKEECLRNRFGSLVIVHNGETTYPLFHFKTSCNRRPTAAVNAMNETLKSNLCRLLFNKEKI